MLKKNRALIISVIPFILGAAHVSAKEVIHVFLLGGQSNMLGREDISESNPLLVEKMGEGGIAGNAILYHHNYRGTQTLSANGFSPLAPRPSNDGQMGNFGPELTFGRDIQKALGDQKVVLLKYSVGGTGLSKHWFAGGTDDPSSDGEMYTGFKELVRAGLSRLKSDNPDAEIRVEAMLWHQGEGDVGTASARYETNLTHFIHGVRHDLNLPDLPFFIGGLSDIQGIYYKRHKRYEWMQIVLQAQKDVAAADPNSWFVSLDEKDGLTTQPVELHFDVNGYKVMGERFASVLLNEISCSNK